MLGEAVTGSESAEAVAQYQLPIALEGFRSR